MTKKDYVVIANIIAALDLHPTDRMKVANRFCSKLRELSPTFKPAAFIAHIEKQMEE